MMLTALSVLTIINLYKVGVVDIYPIHDLSPLTSYCTDSKCIHTSNNAKIWTSIPMVQHWNHIYI